MVYRKPLSRTKKRTKRSKVCKINAQKVQNRKFVTTILENVIENAFINTDQKSESSTSAFHDCSQFTEELAGPSTSSDNNNCTEQVVSLQTNTATESDDDDEYNFTWGSLDEYDLTQDHQLETEIEPEKTNVSGYRIVDIDYFLKKTLRLQTDHNKNCTSSNLEYVKELRKGLVSAFIYKCNMCSKEFTIDTEKPKEISILNNAAVWGTLSVGSTYSHLTELLSVLDIPPMSGNLFFEIQRELGYLWKDSLYEIMDKAGKEEYRLAIEKGDIDKDGVPFITVYLDGGWSKRSYGHNYNAASVVAVIIGKTTGKLLYVGVHKQILLDLCKSRK